MVGYEIEEMSGRFVGIGVGPGDPELLTLRGARIISESPVISYPVIKSNSLARSIVREHIRSDHIELPVTIDDFLDSSSAYDTASSDIASHLDSGRDVCFLCEGDPFFFGSFVYLHERLSPNYPCEIIAGVSSVMASACLVGRPLGVATDSVTIIPATCDDAELLERLHFSGTIVFLKVGERLGGLIELIRTADRLVDSYFVSRVGYSDEIMCPLSEVDLSSLSPNYFSVVITYGASQ